MERFNNRIINIIYFIASILYMMFLFGFQPAFIWIIVGLTFAAVLFIILRAIAIRYFSLGAKNHSNEQQRRLALNTVRLYLAPHSSIWKDLRVANKYCVLTLGKDGKKIIVRERKDAYGGECQNRSFRVISSNIHSYEELWNMLCLNFDHQTSYESMLELCEKFNAQIIETNLSITKTNETNQLKNEPANNAITEKVDINNASEVEITALPGISIVLSKRLIKQREAIGGFKSTDEVFEFLKLKPHMEKQLRCLICVNKMKGSVNIKINRERSVDI